MLVEVTLELLSQASRLSSIFIGPILWKIDLFLLERSNLFMVYMLA